MDTGQVDTEFIEDQMRQTRVRLDRKLDALNARTWGARQQAGWVMPALVGVIGAAVWMRARRRRRARRWSDVDAAPGQYAKKGWLRRGKRQPRVDAPARTRQEPPWLYNDTSHRWP
jgi:hypothetical protein